MKPYPQKPLLTQDELVAFLNEAPIARLSSLNPDGTIHVAETYLSSLFTCVVVRIKPKHMTSYDYSKSGIISTD